MATRCVTDAVDGVVNVARSTSVPDSRSKATKPPTTTASIAVPPRALRTTWRLR